MLIYRQIKKKKGKIKTMIKYLKYKYILYKIKQANYNYFTIKKDNIIQAIVINNKIYQ